MTNLVPGGVNFVSATASQGSCAFSAGAVTCALGSLGPGGTVNLAVVLAPTTSGLKTSTFTVGGAEQDLSPADNTASVNTKNEQRDGHLKSPDFFDATNYPKMTFVSTGVRKLSEHEYKVDGNLTIRNEHEPRVGAELAYAQGDRRVQASREGFG